MRTLKCYSSKIHENGETRKTWRAKRGSSRGRIWTVDGGVGRVGCEYYENAIKLLKKVFLRHVLMSLMSCPDFFNLKCISGQTNRSSALKRLLVGSPMSVLSFIFPNGRLVAPPGRGGAGCSLHFLILLSRSEEIF